MEYYYHSTLPPFTEGRQAEPRTTQDHPGKYHYHNGFALNI